MVKIQDVKIFEKKIYDMIRFPISTSIHYKSSRQLTTSRTCTSTMTAATKTPVLTWTRLNPKPDPTHGIPCTRSSHGVSAIIRSDGTQGLFVYGGEHVARTPIESNDAGWICDNNMTQWKCVDCSPETNNGPPPRVAHAQATYDNRCVYVFGGRTGIGMQESPLDDMWLFDTITETWSKVEPDVDGGDPVPAARSFHRMICIGSGLFLFGGCGAAGRLNDLHRFDIATKKWNNLGKSQLRGRGGPSVFPINSGSSIAIVSGFAGEETNDGHIYDIQSGKWADAILSSELSDLRPRSVCVSGSFPSVGVSICFGGEVDPSDRGHEGAGGFENDIVLFNETNGHLIQTVKNDASSNNKEWPEQRGWSESASVDHGNGKGELFVFGGLTGDDESPKRLDDLWKLDIQSAVQSQ
jgi:Galactose oxidase, central domain